MLNGIELQFSQSYFGCRFFPNQEEHGSEMIAGELNRGIDNGSSRNNS